MQLAKESRAQSWRQPAVAGKQGCVPALLDFLSMIPDLSVDVGENTSGSMLAGCERDTKHLAFKALTFLQQVTVTELCSCKYTLMLCPPHCMHKVICRFTI